MDTDAISKAVHEIRRQGIEGVEHAIDLLSNPTSKAIITLTCILAPEERSDMIQEIERVMRRYDGSPPESSHAWTCGFCGSHTSREEVTHWSGCAGVKLLKGFGVTTGIQVWPGPFREGIA